MPELKAPRRGRNIIGDQVRKARSAHCPPFTQDQLSAKLSLAGVSLDRAAVAKIENGLRGVYDFELLAIADVLAVDVRWLLKREPRGKREGRKP